MLLIRSQTILIIFVLIMVMVIGIVLFCYLYNKCSCYRIVDFEQQLYLFRTQCRIIVEKAIFDEMKNNYRGSRDYVLYLFGKVQRTSFQLCHGLTQ